MSTIKPDPPGRRKRRTTLVGGAAVSALLLSACSDAEGADNREPAEAGAGLSALNHVHGVAADAGDGMLLATHEGLFRLSAEGGTRLGPVIDLMGFAVVGPDHFIASGHPGPGVDMPQPVGLIESVDGGDSWRALSRGGESDFHALTATEGGMLGYDGSLLRSADGRTWDELELPAPPAGLAASGDGQRVLATTEQGILLSADAGTSWSPVPDAPLLQLVDWTADGRTAVGIDPDGAVWISSDGAATWHEGAELGAAPQAIDVATAADGSTRVVVVTTSAIVESRDGGTTFAQVMQD